MNRKDLIEVDVVAYLQMEHIRSNILIQSEPRLCSTDERRSNTRRPSAAAVKEVQLWVNTVLSVCLY